MRRYHKLQIISVLLLLFVLSFSVFGQGETVNFTWKDKQKNLSNGSLALSWKNNALLGHWELQLNVKWYDAGGEAIAGSESMPFIYLSDYDIEIKSGQKIECLNFSVSENIFELQFQDRGELRFNIPANIEKPGTLEIIFRYALSEKDIANANIDPIVIPGKQNVSIAFPDTRPQENEVVSNDQEKKPNLNNDLTANQYPENSKRIRNNLLLLAASRDNFNKQLSADDNNIITIRETIDSSDPADTLKKGAFENSLQKYLADANVMINNIDSAIIQSQKIRLQVINEALSTDSSLAFGKEIEGLEADFRSLRREFVQNRVQIRGLFEELGSSFTELYLSGMKKAVENKYSELFARQVDSAGVIQKSYAELEPALMGEMRKGPRKADNNERLEGFRESHIQLKALLDTVYEEHREAYFNYRKEIDETGVINSLETQHVRFDDIYSIVRGRIDMMDLEISRLVSSMNGQLMRPVPAYLVIGGGLLLLFLLILLARFSRRGNKYLQGTRSKGLIPNTNAADSGGFDFIDDGLDQSAEYYKIVVPQVHQDIMVSELHLHIRFIKSVYHLVQGALMDKKAEDFGGLIFGRQYKAHGSGSDKHIMIAERLVPAANIRPDMSAEIKNGDLLVEEIEKMVLENKKMVLLGWLSSSRDKDLEMPENQIKVHRTYFREKWQIACLVYPGSEKMDSGFFVRRKSGFFDTIPGEGLKYSFDNLYQFAVNPPSKKDMEEKKRPDTKNYLKLQLNQNWCDSIVENLFIHHSVIKEVAFEKENKIQFVAGQVASAFFYGDVWKIPSTAETDGTLSYEVFINKLAPSAGNENPRELPGSELLGWIRFDDNEIFEILKEAIPYHNEIFKLPFQMSVLVNSSTGEIRFFSRKHSLEMNNNTIETEEFNLDALISAANPAATGQENNLGG